MSPEVKSEWVQALRSDKYEQCRTRLRIGDCYCALGVLCDLLGESGWKQTEQGDWFYRYESSIVFSSLSKTIMDELGISLHDVTTITTANDMHKMTFPQIADLIEAL